MLIAEDLLLLLLDDEDGSQAASSHSQVALGGAVLAELALAGQVAVGEKAHWWGAAKVRTDGSPPGDPVLARAYAVVAEKERSAQDLVERLGKGLRDELLAALAARGLLEERRDRMWGVFPRTRWPAVDSRHEQQVRTAIEATLLQGQDPDPRTATLIALLSALDQAHRVVEHPGLSGRQVRTRAKEIAEGQWAPAGVADAIAAANAAVLAAITASTSAATTATGT